MKFRHLEYFVAAAEELNFTHAADRLNVSQPPFSKQIHDLEGELGAEFLERQRKEVTLTPAGKSFLIDARADPGRLRGFHQKGPADQPRRDWGTGHWSYVSDDARFLGQGIGLGSAVRRVLFMVEHCFYGFSVLSVYDVILKLCVSFLESSSK